MHSEFREVISDITRKMGSGMLVYYHQSPDTAEQWDEVLARFTADFSFSCYHHPTFILGASQVLVKLDVTEVCGTRDVGLGLAFLKRPRVGPGQSLLIPSFPHFSCFQARCCRR